MIYNRQERRRGASLNPGGRDTGGLLPRSTEVRLGGEIGNRDRIARLEDKEDKAKHTATLARKGKQYSRLGFRFHGRRE